MLPNDPFILLSVINTKLRDEFPSLQELCTSLGVNEADIVNRLHSAGFDYVPTINQFR